MKKCSECGQRCDAHRMDCGYRTPRVNDGVNPPSKRMDVFYIGCRVHVVGDNHSWGHGWSQGANGVIVYGHESETEYGGSGGSHDWLVKGDDGDTWYVHDADLVLLDKPLPDLDNPASIEQFLEA